MSVWLSQTEKKKNSIYYVTFVSCRFITCFLPATRCVYLFDALPYKHLLQMSAGIGSAMGACYASVYWCIFPPTVQETVVPRLQDCQDSLTERLSKLKQQEGEIRETMLANRMSRDRTKLRRLLLQRNSILKDIQVTEATLCTVDRQISLFERSNLDSIIIDTLQSSSAALSNMRSELPGIDRVEDITETLQNRMQEVNEITETVASALQRGLDEDYSTLDKDLDDFFAEELGEPPSSTLASAAVPLAKNTTSEKTVLAASVVSLEKNTMSERENDEVDDARETDRLLAT